MHAKVNHTLSIIALVLGIILMLVALFLVIRAGMAWWELQQALGDLGGEGDLPVECWDPGSGEVCAPGGADGMPGGE